MSDIDDTNAVDMAEYRRRLDQIMKQAENDPEMAKYNDMAKKARDMVVNGEVSLDDYRNGKISMADLLAGPHKNGSED